ncbi:MAG: hypothetical protein MJZ51_07785, partial [Bacteroidales bacterium]|nr:hypothetical protein [Bacteroidales bacterium]
DAMIERKLSQLIGGYGKSNHAVVIMGGGQVWKPTLLAVLFVLAALCSCTRPQWELMQQEALSAEAAILNADELVEVLGSDTTHFKAVYFFSSHCSPCQEHLRNEVLQLYRSCDTNVWRVYLVAELNNLHRLVPGADGDLEEASLSDNISHFSKQYRSQLTSLGYDMADVRFFYDARWDLDQGMDQSAVVRRAFTSDQEFKVDNGVPMFLMADPHNHIKTSLRVSRAVERVVEGIPELGPITTSYAPSYCYSLEAFDYTRHDTVYSIDSRCRYDHSRLPPFDEIFEGWCLPTNLKDGR